MKRHFATTLPGILLLAALSARAQEIPVVTARVEPDSIMIGDRFDYVIDVEKGSRAGSRLPRLRAPRRQDRTGRKLPRGYARTRRTPPETPQALPPGRLRRGQVQPRVAEVLYADKNILDTLRSRDSLYLEVATFQIDSTSQSIYDLKAQKTLALPGSARSRVTSPGGSLRC